MHVEKLNVYDSVNEKSETINVKIPDDLFEAVNMIGQATALSYIQDGMRLKAYTDKRLEQLRGKEGGRV